MARSSSILTVSEKLLLAVKMNLDTIPQELSLHTVTLDQLKKELYTDEAKKTFWINIYNAYFQIIAAKVKTNRKNIFSKKEIKIAQNYFSLDDIEHGILRKNRWKWSFGYAPNPFASSILKELAVYKIDFRIHFALNCGAKSCPPIAFYTHKKIDQQLDTALFSFLVAETSIDTNTKTITTTKLLSWYRADFGGKKGIKHILGLVLKVHTATYKICFKPYSWESHLEHYA